MLKIPLRKSYFLKVSKNDVQSQSHKVDKAGIIGNFCDLIKDMAYIKTFLHKGLCYNPQVKGFGVNKDMLPEGIHITNMNMYGQ
jgi:hypothetical protein